jgi:hypothetical protein
MGRTEKDAREYARQMEEIHNDGEKWLVFRTPKNTEAYKHGLFFGTCRASERADYAAGGAVFLDKAESK